MYGAVVPAAQGRADPQSPIWTLLCDPKRVLSLHGVPDCPDGPGWMSGLDQICLDGCQIVATWSGGRKFGNTQRDGSSVTVDRSQYAVCPGVHLLWAGNPKPFAYALAHVAEGRRAGCKVVSILNWIQTRSLILFTGRSAAWPLVREKLGINLNLDACLLYNSPG